MMDGGLFAPIEQIAAEEDIHEKNKLYAIGLGLVLGLASPCIPSFAETEAQLPELEAPSETEASAETQAPSETEAPSESELPAETEAPPATDAQKESETLSAPQTGGTQDRECQKQKGGRSPIQGKSQRTIPRLVQGWKCLLAAVRHSRPSRNLHL